MDSSEPNLCIEKADSFWSRFRGLMFRDKLPSGTGLLLSPCNSIHMMFMRFSIDAVFLDARMKVVKISRGLKPWTGMSACRNADHVLELTAGDADGIFVGDDLSGVIPVS